MAAEDSIKRLEERLTRLEATLAQQPAAGAGGFPPPGGVIVDPAPWGGGGWTFHPRPFPTPVVDPAPWWQGRWGHPRWPTPVVDPAPWPTPVVDPAPWPTPVVDPAPMGGFAQFRPTAASTFGRIGQIGDPPPIDISRLTVSQLESSLHTINAEKARLNSMEAMLKQQLERVKQQPG
ncbi:MAG: hypothetical protein AB7G68_10660 [Nitrospiraceae bacterium]